MAGIDGVEGVLRIHVQHEHSGLLCLTARRHHERGLARGLRTVDLHDTATWDTADSRGQVQLQRPGVDDLILRPLSRRSVEMHDLRGALHLVHELFCCMSGVHDGSSLDE